ncbi:MAG: hypothetical protein ACRCYD_01765 [Plesiomonas sp.]
MSVESILREIVDDCNKLARKFYRMQGYVVGDDFKFYEATHPAEVMCWEMAKEAYSQIQGTEIDQVIDDLEDY